MKKLLILLVLSTNFYSCNKEEKRLYSMAGAYHVTEIKQIVYINGVLESEEIYSDVGTMELRYPETGAVSEQNGSFNVTNPNVPIIAFQELGNKYSFNWRNIWDEKRLSLVWTDFLNTYGLTFTITVNKNRKKELFFIYTETDDDGNLIENMEFYSLELI